MAVQNTFQSISVDPQTGVVRIRFATKDEHEWPSVAEFQADIKSRADEAQRLLKLQMLGMLYKRQPNLTNVANLVGRGLRMDLTATTNVVTVI
jgi:hypothetical protein